MAVRIPGQSPKLFPAYRVDAVVDTTAAGDTFTGYAVRALTLAWNAEEKGEDLARCRAILEDGIKSALMTVENILLDCDPGLDDAAAIFLAAGSPRIHVLGITTVAGNQTIERVTKNAFFVAKMAGMGDVPIARGSARPLLRPQVQVCSEIHGHTGGHGASHQCGSRRSARAQDR